MNKYKNIVGCFLLALAILVVFDGSKENNQYKKEFFTLRKEEPVLMGFKSLTSTFSTKDWVTTREDIYITDQNIIDKIWSVIINRPKYTDLRPYEHFGSKGAVKLEVTFRSGNSADFQIEFGQRNILTVGLLIDENRSRNYYSPGGVWIIFRGQGKNMGDYLFDIIPLEER